MFVPDRQRTYALTAICHAFAGCGEATLRASEIRHETSKLCSLCGA